MIHPMSSQQAFMAEMGKRVGDKLPTFKVKA